MTALKHASARRRRRGVLTTVAVGLVTLMVLVVIVSSLAGYRLLVMATPSMCPKVCVGALVVDEAPTWPLHKGELISFHPPGSPKETYTHEVARVLPGGYAQTHGVANKAIDPWVIDRPEVTGRAVLTVPGVGWLVKALPILAVGTMSWALARSWVTARSRRTWDRACMTALVVAPLWALHPLVRGAVVTTALDKGHKHWQVSTVANTGLLPARFFVSDGTAAPHVAPGRRVILSGPSTGHGVMTIHQTLSLYWWGWAIVAAIVVSPVLGYLWHVVRDNEVAAAEVAADDDEVANTYRPVHLGPRRPPPDLSLPDGTIGAPRPAQSGEGQAGRATGERTPV